MKAVVTGVAGFVGSHLAERLLESGAEVTGIDCFTNYYARSLKEANLVELRTQPRFHLVETSIQMADWSRLLDGTTHVFHLAAQAGVRRSWGGSFSVYTACNIDATQVVLEACVASSIVRLVYASSSSVYGDGVPIPMREDARPQPVSPYGVTKLAAEHLCQLYWASYDVPTVALRYFTVYGPRQRPDMAFNRFLRAIQSGQSVTVYGDGEQTRDFTYVGDAVTATIAAADRGTSGDVYNIGGGSQVSMNHVLELLASCTGRTPAVTHEPAQKGDMRDTYADTSSAHEHLGFVPHVGLEDGIRAEYDWLTLNPVTT